MFSTLSQEKRSYRGHSGHDGGGEATRAQNFGVSGSAYTILYPPEMTPTASEL
jgi:hypothetical protein